MIIKWDQAKNRLLQKRRGLSFELIESLIEQDKALDLLQHPNPKYKHQWLYIVEVNNYIYVVPFVQDKDQIFLKTIYPSRVMTKKYLNKETL